MQRGFAALFAALFVLSVSALIAGARRPTSDGSATASSVAGPSSAGAASTTTAGSSSAGASSAAREGAPPAGSAEADESDAGNLLPNGQVAPPLAADAPKTVVFGVIVVTFEGAQGAPATARSRPEAEKLAKELATLAKTDFKAALAKGDKESLENAGRMPRGMLEAAPEYVLFSLPKGEVSEPVETPRGFWILRRIE
jgi:hypothetical protein